MASDNSDYYRERAAEERRAALAAAEKAIARIHEEMAVKYDALARQAEESNGPGFVPVSASAVVRERKSA